MLYSLKHIGSIAAGGALGAVARFLVSTWALHTFKHLEFPLGTLLVNTIGCFLMGILGIVLLERFHLHLPMRGLVLTGFLGAFTTFSAFSIETLSLFEYNQAKTAILSIVLNLSLSLGGVWLGVLLGRKLCS